MDKPSDRRIKRSYGILLCRYNLTRSCYEFLLEQRPYRYGFVQFLTHHYNKSDFHTISQLINDMSPEDKVTLSSLNFDACYSRIYRQIPPPGSDRYHSYLIHKTHFEHTFLSDGGHWLLDQLSRGGRNALHWDIPRGRKSYAAETDLVCALREFTEETRIPQTDYTIISAEPMVQRFESFGWHYINTFFLAVLTNRDWHDTRNLRIEYSRSYQHSEVIDLRWMGLQEISVVDTYQRLYRFLKSATNLLKKKHRLKETAAVAC
jgi:8-oxo-dGTP pyrophosphatase MutT (NUDIX family)